LSKTSEKTRVLEGLMLQIHVFLKFCGSSLAPGGACTRQARGGAGAYKYFFETTSEICLTAAYAEASIRVPESSGRGAGSGLAAWGSGGGGGGIVGSTISPEAPIASTAIFFLLL
jgi:hypothetical protein